MLLRRHVAIAIGVLMLSGCGHHAAPTRSEASATKAGPDAHALDPSRAPPGLEGQYAKLTWERQGEWRTVNVDHPDGSRDVMLVAQDPFGDRVIASRGGGYAIWRGRITCPQGKAEMVEGALFMPHAKHATPAGTFAIDPASAHLLCDMSGTITSGTPTQVSGQARSYFPRPVMTADYVRRMDAEMAARHHLKALHP